MIIYKILSLDLYQPRCTSRLVEYDEVYISCIFTKSADTAKRLAKQFPNSIVHLGGSGVDLVTKLPPEIESLKPDNSIYHDIYPETKYTSYGFATRGCIRKCPFCIVPTKEGKIHPVGDLYSVWNKEAGHTHVVLLDNNILALPDNFEKVADQILQESLTLDINQGMDIRLVNPDNAAIIKKLKLQPYPRLLLMILSWSQRYEKESMYSRALVSGFRCSMC